MVDSDDFRKNIACSSLSNSIVVQAGPGSGKTTLLINRLKYIIENRFNSLSGIACITYTNVGKDEIITRLRNDGVQLPAELFVGTIHSFLLDYIIKPYSHFAHKERKPYKLASFGFSRGYKREIGEMLNRPIHFIDEGTLKAFESLGRDEKGEPICYGHKISPEVALAWKQLIIEKGYIDQQDAIYLSYWILNKYEHIRNAFSFRFPYILVDEYQDVTFYQEKFFSLLTHSSFFCVGDKNQSIYSFTGANPELFNAMWENDNFNTFTLSNNFRSTSHIVKFANCKTAIVQVEAGINAKSKQKVLFFKDIKEFSEAIQLFQHLQKNIDCDAKIKPYMILARQNDYVNSLTQFVKKQEVTLNPFLKKLKEESYRCFQILNNILLAISFKRSNDIEKAINRMAEAFSHLFFNEHPNYVSLSEIGYNRFMWKKLQIFTLHYVDNLVLTETTVADLFLQIKEFLSKTSKNLYGKPIGTKIRMLNYKWKNQIKMSKSTMVSHLVEQVESQADFNQNQIMCLIFTVQKAWKQIAF